MTKKLFVPEYKCVDKYTRAGNSGKEIVCPECNSKARVFHFSWSALGCQDCKYIVDKYDWRLAD